MGWISFRKSVPYHLIVPAGVTLTVYDLPGRHIMTLMDESHDEGTPCMHWVAADAHGSPLDSGSHFLRPSA